jgi:hypothetical protein
LARSSARKQSTKTAPCVPLPAIQNYVTSALASHVYTMRHAAWQTWLILSVVKQTASWTCPLRVLCNASCSPALPLRVLPFPVPLCSLTCGRLLQVMPDTATYRLVSAQSKSRCTNALFGSCIAMQFAQPQLAHLAASLQQFAGKWEPHELISQAQTSTDMCSWVAALLRLPAGCIKCVSQEDLHTCAAAK